MFKVGDKVRRVLRKNGKSGLQVGEEDEVVEVRYDTIDGEELVWTKRFPRNKGNSFNCARFLQLVKSHKTFKVGDRVRVYQCTGAFNGTVAEAPADVTGTEGHLYVVLDSPHAFGDCVSESCFPHPKQCRKLRKKDKKVCSP